jgi:hypothetical protein
MRKLEAKSEGAAVIRVRSVAEATQIKKLEA